MVLVSTLRGRYYKGLNAFKDTHALEEASFWGYTAILSSLLQAAAQNSVHEQYYMDAYAAASFAGHVRCVTLIGIAAQERGFAQNSTRVWYTEEIPSSPDTFVAAMSRYTITIEVKTLNGQWISVQVPGYCQGIVLINAVKDCPGLSPDHLCLIVRHNSRRIADDQRLCNIGVRNGCLIELTLTFKARIYWIGDESEDQSALHDSAEEAEQGRSKSLG